MNTASNSNPNTKASGELVEMTYKKSTNLLTVHGWFFRNTNMVDQCGDIIETHFMTDKKLTVIFKAELIDALTFTSFSKLIDYLNKLSTHKDIRTKWIATGETMNAGLRLKHQATFPFNILSE